MRKIRLELETLAVESFVTASSPQYRGTVEANIGTAFCNTIDNTCDGAATCGGQTCRMVDYSCAPSCGACGTYECTGEGSGSICGGGSGIGCTSGYCGPSDEPCGPYGE